jgi:hypothetical protein
MNSEGIFTTAQVYERFCALFAIAPAMGGLLVFYGEADMGGLVTAAAANIAGAASLGVDEDPHWVKFALRQGICDFMVNDLDEALRILKNEIRRKQAVSVVLVSGPNSVVTEMLERGVQPDVVLPGKPGSEAFVQRGTAILEGIRPDGRSEVTWSVEQEPAVWLPRLDALAIEVMGHAAGDNRALWLQRAPRYLRNLVHHERYVRMSAEELERFHGLIRERISVPVLLRANAGTF